MNPGSLLPMAFTAADLTAIDAAIASGELVVKKGDRQVTYRSMDELQKARQMISDALASSTGGLRHRLADFADDD